MNKLPLSPEDVTEFTCEDAAYWALCDNMRGNSTQGRNAIRAEWQHRITERLGSAYPLIYSEYYDQQQDGLGMQAEALESAHKLKLWLDSLKGGQNG